jgi:uncharacterized membrane protein YphA (DoxX/SURF4 family)
MNNLDRFMEFLVAGIFLWAGLRRIFNYRRRPRALGARHRQLPLGIPYAAIVAVGLFEIVAALAIVTQYGPFSQVTVVRLAAVGLGVLTAVAAIYRVRLKESAAPTIALFLMVMFVLVGRM